MPRTLQPRETPPLRAVATGLLAGAAGTAAMTVWQEVASRVQATDDRASGREERTAEDDPWESAPVPAKVARRVIRAMSGRDVEPARIGLLTNLVHWSYGTAWGAVYGLLQTRVRANVLGQGAVFGTGVWLMSYVQLVPTGFYEPPWSYPAKVLARDFSYHLVYGVAVARAYHALGADRYVLKRRIA